MDDKRVRGSHNSRPGQYTGRTTGLEQVPVASLIGQVIATEKSSKGRATSELPRASEIAGWIIAIDALSCQKAIIGDGVMQGGE